jgi:hypothetical protein
MLADVEYEISAKLNQKGLIPFPSFNIQGGHILAIAIIDGIMNASLNIII